MLALLYAPSLYHLVFCRFCSFSRTSLLWGLSLTYSLVRLLTCLLGFTRLSDKLADELTEKLLILKPESPLLDGTHGFYRRGTHLYYVCIYFNFDSIFLFPYSFCFWLDPCPFHFIPVFHKFVLWYHISRNLIKVFMNWKPLL